MLRSRSRGGVLPSTLLLVLCFPATVNAHTPIKGLEGLAAGVLHPLTTPAHLLVLLALGLLVGQQLPLDLKTPFAVFVPGLTVALLLTATGQITMVYQPILIALILCAANP
jgi:hydrogenase/urease accessory protein HupE